MPITPTTPEGLHKYDLLPPPSAVVKAWTEPGVNKRYHERMKQEVRNAMPLLGAALDRMAYPSTALPRTDDFNLNDEPYKAFEEWKERHPL